MQDIKIGNSVYWYTQGGIYDDGVVESIYKIESQSVMDIRCTWA